MSSVIFKETIGKALNTTMINLVDGIVDHTDYEVGGDVDGLLHELSAIKFMLERIDVQDIIDELTCKISDIARKDDKCPKCFYDLVANKYEEVHNHLDDKPIEYFAYYECESCGWNDRDDR